MICVDVSLTVEITFEETVYSTSEIAGIVAVCVTATSGILSFNLPVNIDLLPSTAIGMYIFSSILFIVAKPNIMCTCPTSQHQHNSTSVSQFTQLCYKMKLL